MQDDKLLSQYARDGSEAAFAQIVARHLTLVYSTCLRETGSPSQAEDAAQVVFLLLARKAKTLRPAPSLAGWLYQTARFVARDVRKQEARRQRREQAVTQELTHAQGSPAPEWEQIEPLLNDALSTLKPTEREAVLLRFLEGHSLAETGALLNLSEDAARMRVSRAVEKLRRHLTAHGAVVTRAVLTGLLTSDAARPLPAHAAAFTQGTLHALSVGPTANVLLLSKGVFQTMKLIKFKVAALAAGLLLAGASVPRLVLALSPHKASVQVLATPTPLTENATTNFTLDKDQHAFYSITLPKGEAVIILDTRRADGKWGGTNCRLDFAEKGVFLLHGSASDQDRKMFLSSSTPESRVTARSRLQKPKSLIVEVLNQGERCQYWLTTLHTNSSVDTSASGASPALSIPLFGDTIPMPLALGENKIGRLEKNGFAYFLISLKAGQYQSRLDFSTLSGNPAKLDGSLSPDDEKGLLLFNEGRAWPTGDTSTEITTDFAHRDISRFTLKHGGVFLVQINARDSRSGNAEPVNFAARILPDDAASPAKQNTVEAPK